MKKRVLVSILLILLVLATTVLVPNTSHAAEAGTTMNNPININFGPNYTKSWTKSTDHLYCYNKLNVTKRGIVKMTFSKPFDSEGEYGRLEICVYDKDGNPIWNTKSSKTVETASSNYNYYIGLDKGTYYVAVKPGFTVRSGTITTNYNKYSR